MDEGRIRKIIHVDMDAFYASVEQRDDPTLRGKPVAVGYPAKRGVVAAASYEARGFGVRSAMPSTVAARKCAELVFVPPRFDVYREVSKQVQAIFKDYTPLVEPLSLDEAYLDVSDNLKEIPTAWETAKEIRARIHEEIRLTASAGISCNKFLAKIASDYRKPNGQFAILPDEAEAFVATLPIAKFHGVGPKTAAKMHALGIETGADLRGQTRAFLQEQFGKAGNWYFEIARGQDDRPVVCPAKAGMFSRRKACRGKSQKPRSLDSRVAGNQNSEAYRQRLPRGDDEPPGRNESKRECGLENA